VDPAWRISGPDSDASDQLMRSLADALRDAGGLVIAVTSVPMRPPAGLHLAPDGPVHPLAGANGSLAGANSSPAAGWPTGLAAELELEAGGTSAFYESRLDSILQRGGYQDLLLVGWGLEGPVHSTMRAANDSGYECLLVADACTTLQPELAFSACEMVRFSGGIFGAFADAADVIQTLASFGPEARPSPETGASDDR